MKEARIYLKLRTCQFLPCYVTYDHVFNLCGFMSLTKVNYR